MGNQLKRRIWAVVCGAVRKEFELYNILALLCEWRSEELLEGIVISTWRREIENIPNLRKKLDFLNIHIIETTPLEEEEGKYANLNYSRQATQLNEALNFIPEDVFVLKCRTDFCIDELKKVRKVMYEELHPRTIGFFVPPLFHRIIVRDISLSAPFCFEDRVFFGYKSDIRKMAIFENVYRYMGNGMAPDCLFFLNCFLHNYAIIGDYIRVVDYWKVARMMNEGEFTGGVEKSEDFYLPGPVNKFYALYFIIIYTCFWLIESKESSETPEQIIDLFRENVKKGTKKSWLLYNNDFRVYEKVVYGDMASTNGFIKLHKEICRITQQKGYVNKMYFERSDYEDAARWNRGFIKQKSHKWYIERRISSIKSSINFLQANDILFSEYNLNDGQIYRLKEIVLSEKNYYRAIIDELDGFQKENALLYEKALFASARCLDDHVMQIIAMGLYYEKFVSGNTIEAESMFERYIKRNAAFAGFFTNLTKERLLAIYYYGKYSTQKGGDYAKKAYERIQNYLGGDFENQECLIKDYSDKLVCYLSHIVDKMSEEKHNQKEQISGFLDAVKMEDDIG